MGTAEWESATLTGLIEHILGTHHAYLRGALPKLAESAEAEGPGALRKTVLELKSELESHMWKEEMVLFPLIRVLEESRSSGKPAPPAHCGSVRNPISVMGQEHQAARQALLEIRRLTRKYEIPAGASSQVQALVTGLREFDQDLQQHIHLEDDILFPRAIELEAGQG
jgi:regulator of cell morphogenesis and NO signaling